MAGRVASRIALFVVGAIPGAAGFFAGQPVLGGALLIACEALVAVGSVAGDVIAELRKRWTARLVDRLDAAMGHRIARFERLYRDKMLSTFRFMDSKGLPTKGFFTPELDDVYVHVKVAPGTPHKVRTDLLAKAEVAERHQVDDFLDEPSPQILAVIGAPGSGKTTLLRHTAKQACVRHRRRRRNVPVLLYLRDHVAQIVQHPDVALPALIRLALARQGVEDPDGWFDDRLQAGRCLVLLDGLDEVARAEDRRLIAEWVDSQVTRYAKNDFVITSRPAGYRTAEIANAKVLQVCNFNAEQVRTFVQRWYLALEKWATRADEDTTRDLAREAASDLLDRLDRAPALYELTVNPLLLTMIANVHHHRGALPGSRADLYSEICQAMLWRRQEAKKLQADVPGEKKEALLRKLAFTMMEREVRDLPRADVLALIKPALRRVSREMAADEFLADVSSNGLIIERESGLYSFAHLTFQEYLAANHIRDRDLSSTLASHVDNVWWRETTLLYAARSDADEILLACLDSATVTALALAFDCCDQNSELDPDLRDQLEDLLATAFKPNTSPEQRRLMTAVVVARHLRQLVRTDTGLVCARPITNRIYRLFLQDTGHPEPDGFDASQPDEDLVVGVHDWDTVAFAEWASVITENKTAYRLVTHRELENGDVRRAIAAAAPNARECSIWLHPTSGDRREVPFFWSSSTRHDQYQVTSAQLAQRVRDDIVTCLPDLLRLLLVRALLEVRDLTGKRPGESDADYTMTVEKLHRAIDRAQYLAEHRSSQTEFAAIAILPGVIPHSLRHEKFGALLLGGKITADDMVSDLSPELARTLALDEGFDNTRSPDQVMGNTLSLLLYRFLADGADFSSWEDSVADEFLRHIDIADTVYTVYPGAMEDRVGKASALVSDALRETYDNPGNTWSGRVAMALGRLSASFVGRRAPMTAQMAAALRLTLFCLAGEEFVSGTQLSLALQELAAGTMVLEARASGESPPSETILLAVS